MRYKKTNFDDEFVMYSPSDVIFAKKEERFLLRFLLVMFVTVTAIAVLVERTGIYLDIAEMVGNWMVGTL